MYNVVKTNLLTGETITKVTDLNNAVIMAGNTLLWGGAKIAVYDIVAGMTIYENDGYGWVTGCDKQFKDAVWSYYKSI